jgi:2-oxoglutarate-Fe(II)-dependent oxygenase superfamily protein
MLRLTESAVPSEQFSVPEREELERLHEEFESRHCVLLPGLLEPRLADTIAARIEASDFYRREHDGIGVEDCMEPNGTLAWLLLLVNDNRMRDVVRSITGCGPIASFDGRVYRLDPATDHHDSWHTDLGEDRLVALSINLGRGAYEGGALEIRDRRGGPSTQARNAALGDGLLFEIGEHLEHRVLPIQGDTPRTVFAGWFKGGEGRPFAGRDGG